jgi:hypothetical protein
VNAYRQRKRPPRRANQLQPTWAALSILLRVLVAEYTEAHGLPAPATAEDFGARLAEALAPHPDLESYVIRMMAQRLALKPTP